MERENCKEVIKYIMNIDLYKEIHVKKLVVTFDGKWLSRGLGWNTWKENHVKTTQLIVLELQV